jgi:hypothetical protein
LNLLWLFLLLAVAGFIFPKLETLLIAPTFLLTIAAAKKQDDEGKSALLYLVGTVNWLWGTYLLLAWCVLCVALTHAFAHKPAVDHRWLYYILGFFGCLAPIQFMASFSIDPHRPDPRDDLVKQALALRDLGVRVVFRCPNPECSAPVHPVGKGKAKTDGTKYKAHFEHDKRNPKCKFGVGIKRADLVAEAATTSGA